MKYCTFCGSAVQDDYRFCNVCGGDLNAKETKNNAPSSTSVSSDRGMNFDFSNNTSTPNTEARYEYKVLSQKDKWFSGKFDPIVLEQAINAYAQQGWRVIGCATADIPGFGATRQEFITLLERKV